MDTLVSKSTFYDTVSMIVPGFIMLFAIAKIFNCTCIIDYTKSNIPSYICIFALSYIVGLFIHHISRLLFDDWFRNNPDYIRDAETRFSKIIAVRRLKAKKTNNELDEGIVHDYYIKYYRVVRSTSIPVMEAQVSFLRSMVLVVFIICFMIFIKGQNDSVHKLAHSRCCMVGILILFDALLFLMMFYIQDKIYYRVIEDSHYIDIVNEKIPPLDGADNEGNKKVDDENGHTENKNDNKNNIDKQTKNCKS